MDPDGFDTARTRVRIIFTSKHEHYNELGDQSAYGLASGVVASMRLIGQMLSMGLVSFMFSLYLGQAYMTPELNPVFLKSVNASFALSGTICVIGIYFSLARGKILVKIHETIGNQDYVTLKSNPGSKNMDFNTLINEG